jgi:transcriptional regulator
VSHLPVIEAEPSGQEIILIGHMARANPQWMHFKNNPECMLIFSGPHTYITPTWYPSGCDVPTWNYAVVHVCGTVRLVEDYDEQVEILKQQSQFFERENEHPWEFDIPKDLRDPNLLGKAIISFRIEIREIQAKFKLSQNRSPEDRAGVVEGLLRRSDEMSHRVRDLMLENEASGSKN